MTKPWVLSPTRPTLSHKQAQTWPFTMEKDPFTPVYPGNHIADNLGHNNPYPFTNVQGNMDTQSHYLGREAKINESSQSNEYKILLLLLGHLVLTTW